MEQVTPRNERAVSLEGKLRLLRHMTETLRSLVNTTDAMDDREIREQLRCAYSDAVNIIGHMDICQARVEKIKDGAK
jgi:hypothetical protein